MDEAYAKDKGNILLTYLLDCVTQGKCDDIQVEFSDPEYPDLARVTIGNSLSAAHAVFEFVLPQVVRAAINGGMSWMSSNRMYFAYMEKARLAGSVRELMELYDQMFVEFAKSIAQIKGNYKFSPLVRKCRFYINEHIYEPLSVYGIADALHISTSYLSHIHKKETGESISDYIRRKKISEAIWLLKHTSFSVTYIYGKLNYCSQSYFTDIFRKETGMTPRLFRSNSYSNSVLMQHPRTLVQVES